MSLLGRKKIRKKTNVSGASFNARLDLVFTVNDVSLVVNRAKAASLGRRTFLSVVVLLV